VSSVGEQYSIPIFLAVSQRSYSAKAIFRGGRLCLRASLAPCFASSRRGSACPIGLSFYATTQALHKNEKRPPIGFIRCAFAFRPRCIFTLLCCDETLTAAGICALSRMVLRNERKQFQCTRPGIGIKKNKK